MEKNINIKNKQIERKTIMKGNMTDVIDKKILNEADKDAFEPIISWSEFLTKQQHNCEDEIKEIESEVGKSDFKFIKSISKGSFSEIYQVKHIKDQNMYAIKMIPSSFLKRGRSEKFLLTCMNFHLLTYLINSFQDNDYIYIVLPLADSGDLFTLLRKFNKFNESLSQFYGAQVLLALEYLHNLDIIYRDIKPENILLERSGYIKLTDFGLSKKTDNRTYTMCGTPDYIAPEMILSKGYGKSVDYWSFGILLYEFNSGKTPFFSKSEIRTFEKVVEGKYEEINYFSFELKDIIKNLLQKDCSKRYGIVAQGANKIKSHNWFLSVPWIPLINKEIKPPYIPSID